MCCRCRRSSPPPTRSASTAASCTCAAPAARSGASAPSSTPRMCCSRRCPHRGSRLTETGFGQTGGVTTPPSESGEPLLDGRYRLGERLGGGAVADVFRALDERLQRPVAVKVFRGDAAEQLHRHEAEMRTLAALDHPSLVTVFDAGTDEPTGRPFLVMQLVEGPTLGGELRSGGLTPERAARYGAELADAL